MARRSAVTGLVILLATASVGTGWWLSPRARAEATTGARVPTATATVVRTNLATTEQVSGTLGYAGTYAVVAQGRGGTVTALPRPGQVISRGQRVYEVDGTPVRLFYGGRPSWRTLALGVSDGVDVRQLEQNLVALGYAQLTPDLVFSSATAAGLRSWQRATGQPVTGRLDLGMVTYQPGAIRVATVAASLGAPIGPGAPVLSATSTTVIVTVPVPAAQTYLVHVGDSVSVTMPAGNTTPGRVTAVSQVAVGAPDGGPQQGPALPTVPVTVRLASPGAAANLDQAPVAVTITSQSVTGALAVPITALVALGGGGYGVYVLDGAQRRLVGVTVGIYSDTLVEIKPGALHAGDTVEVPVG